MILGYVWQILGRETFLPPRPSVSSPKNAHSEKVLSIIGISQVARFESADNCLYFRRGNNLRVDCIDGVCIFLSTGIVGWLKISKTLYWKFSSSITEWLD